MTWRYYDMTPKLFPNSWRSLSPSSVSWEQAGDQPEKFALKLRSFAYNVRVLANLSWNIGSAAVLVVVVETLIT